MHPEIHWSLLNMHVAIWKQSLVYEAFSKELLCNTFTQRQLRVQCTFYRVRWFTMLVCIFSSGFFGLFSASPPYFSVVMCWNRLCWNPSGFWLAFSFFDTVCLTWIQGYKGKQSYFIIYYLKKKVSLLGSTLNVHCHEQNPSALDSCLGLLTWKTK